MVDGLALDCGCALAGMTMARRSKALRFAVGGFDNWPQVQNALRDASTRGLLLESFNCLALEHVFSGKPDAAGERPAAIRPILFPGSSNKIACTQGPLADLLTERRQVGARTLKDALAGWLIPRHAADLEDTVLAGKILLWISLADAEDERRAYQTFFAHSSTSISVHDLILTTQ